MVDAALDGLRVVELGDFISAAYGAKLLADLGADVVKVEPPGVGDRSRRHGPFPGDLPHPERSGLYLFLNTNKRSVTIDLEQATGRALVRELASWADVVIHNLPQKRLREHGLSYEALADGRPQLVMSSITVFGYGTPYAEWEATALTATAASGLASRIGDRDRAPLWLPYCAADFQGGAHGAAAALLALRARRLTGSGQHAWVSIVEILGTYMAGAPLHQYIFNQRTFSRNGDHVDIGYPWQIVPVRDGYFEVITFVDEQWQRFVRLLGDPPWKDDERLQDRWMAQQHAADLDPYWYPWFEQRTKAELAATFAEHRIPFQPIHSVDEVVAAEQLEQRSFWVDVDHPEAGSVRLPGAPYRLSETPWAIRRPPPLLGQHTGEVLGELLGRSPAEIVRLRQSGVV